MKKYELTDKTLTNRFIGTLYRIRALRDFGTVKKGDLGGYIKSEDNLSHEGDCWVGGDARVFDNARVFGDAQVLDKATVLDNAQVYDNARVSGEGSKVVKFNSLSILL